MINNYYIHIDCLVVLFCAHLLSEAKVVMITDKKTVFGKMLAKYKVVEAVCRKLSQNVRGKKLVDESYLFIF